MPSPLPRHPPAPPGQRRRCLAVAVAVGCAVALLTAAPARAYVRARTPGTFMPLFWPDPRLTLEVARPPDGLGVSDADLRAAALSAATTWSFPAIPCTGLSLALAPGVVEDQKVARDGNNRIIMRVDDWNHDASIVALTSVFQRGNPGKPNDGQILEADIELNAVNYSWAVVPEGPISGRDYANTYDLAGVLTHETGHFVGFDHTCAVNGAAPLIDDQGAPYPDCYDLPVGNEAMFMDATMYPFMREADVAPRTLTPDDVRAACEVYPPSSVPWQEWSGAVGCAVSPPSGEADNGCSAALSWAVLMSWWAMMSLARHRAGRGARSSSCSTSSTRERSPRRPV